MSTKKENKIVLNETDGGAKLLEGAKAVFDTVSVSYGPKGKNAIIEQSFGRPVVTRDGVTIARATFFSDRAKNLGAQALIEASETTNRIAGDSTTATVVLSYNLLKHSHQAVAAGQHPMDISADLKNDRDTLLSKLGDLVQDVKKGQLEQVSTVSSGDPLIGKLIADAVEYVGEDGGIIAEKAPVNSVEREYVDGYYYQGGFNALQSGKKELNDPLVVVTIRTMRSRTDAIELINNIAAAVEVQQGQPLKLLLVGNIEGDAYASLVDGINRGLLDAIILTPPPSFGSMAKELLEDVALYAGTQPIVELTPMRYSKENAPLFQSYIGTVNRVVATKTDSTIFGNVASEDIAQRVADIKEQIAVEVSDHASERLKDRVAKLEGKIALFRIGAPTDSAKEELEFRVEDAINATRAASKHGIVPGGGTTLLALSKEEGLSEITVKALRDTFRQLLINANLPSEIKLAEALNAPFGKGFNLRKGDDLVDMIKEGVIDPKLAVEQVITNSTDVVANIITVGTTLIFQDDTEE
jgi:chaperonin GroEL